MPCQPLLPILALSIFVASATQAQGSSAQPPRELDGAWELTALNGTPLPLPPEREGGDPAECEDRGEYVGQRVGEGRLVVRTSEMWMDPRSERWVGGIYAYVPEEIICRPAGGVVIALRRDAHNQARPAHDVEPVWRTGSYGMEDRMVSLSAGDHAWRLAARNSGGAGTLTLEDEEGTWTFRRAAPGPRFETPGFATVRGDFDGDGHGDQVSVTPGRHGTGTMMARLAEGAVDRVAEVPVGAEVRIAPRGRVWRNADGTTLRVAERDVVLVSVEPAPGRSDVNVYYIRNGVWVAWAYAPD